MAAKIKLAVEHDGSTYEVVVRPKTLKEFEKKFDQTITEFYQNESITGTYWLAWHASLVAEITSQGFDQWMDGLDDVDTVEIGDEHPKDPKTATSAT